MYKLELSNEQIDIIKYEANLVVIADPGSGKTTTLAYKISDIIPKLKDYQGVIAISYTNKASNELKERALSLVTEVKNSFFGTIDKFYINEIIIPFSKIIYNINTNNNGDFFNILSKDEKYEYLDTLADNLLFNELKKLIKKGIIILEYNAKFAYYILNHSVECQKYLKSRYKYILIDEYQDCDINKHNLFLELVKLGLIGIAVGDPNQSIFNYTGSSSEYLFDLVSKDKIFATKYLDINRRCHQSIVNYSMKFLNPEIEYPIIEDIRVYGNNVIGDEAKISEWINLHIDDVIKKYKFEHYSDIAVLVRSNHTGKLIYESMIKPAFLYLNTPLDESNNKCDILAKQLLFYILGNSKISIDDLLDEYIDNKRKRNRFNYMQIIKEIRSEYIINSEINNSNFFDAINKIMDSNVDFKNIKIVLENKEFIESFKPIDNSKIQIMSIHKSKGSEFKCVIIVNLHEWILPSKRIDNGQYIFNNINECTNLHYVSITRAKELVLLIYNTVRHNKDNTIKKASCSEFIAPNIRLDLVSYRKNSNPWE